MMDWIWHVLERALAAAGGVVERVAIVLEVAWLLVVPRVKLFLKSSYGVAAIALIAVLAIAVYADWFRHLIEFSLITVVILAAVLAIVWVVTAAWQDFASRTGAAVSGWHVLAISAIGVTLIIVFARDPIDKFFENSSWLANTIKHSLVGPEHYVAIAVALPSVQTRERLINDRFEQVAWTDRLLKASMKQLPASWSSPTGNSGNASAKDTNTKPSSDSVTTKEEKPDSSASLGGASASDRSLTQVGGEQAAWFERMLGVRDRIRLERSDAMLDDRHDMDEDTLYNLTFAASVVPEPGTRGYAAVEVLLTNDPDDVQPKAADEARDTTGLPQKTPSEASKETAFPGEREALDRFRSLRRRDMFDIYIDWLSRTQDLVRDDIIDATRVVSLVQENWTDPQLDLASRLRRRWCEDGLWQQAQEPRTQTAIREACRQVVQVRLGPDNAPDDHDVAKSFLTAANNKIAELGSLERQAVAFLEESRSAIYNSVFETSKPALRNHLNALKHLAEEQRCGYAGCRSSLRLLITRMIAAGLSQLGWQQVLESPDEGAPAKTLSPAGWDFLAHALTEPDILLPDFDRSVTACTHGSTGGRGAPGEPARTPPLPALSPLYDELGIFMPPGHDTKNLLDDAPSSVAGLRLSAASTADRDLQPFTLLCPNGVVPFDHLRLLEALVRGVPKVGGAWNVTKVTSSRTGGELDVWLEDHKVPAGNTAAQPKIVTTGLSCLSATQIANLLASGEPGLASGRGAFQYNHFFELDLETDAQGYCGLSIYPLVTSLVDDRNRMHRMSLKSSLPLSSLVNCTQDEHGQHQDVGVEATGAASFLAGEQDWTDDGHMFRSLEGFRPVQIGRGFYPVTGANRSPATLRLGRCINELDAKEAVNEIFFAGEIDILGRLYILLDGPTYTGERPSPTTEAFPYGLTPRLTDEYKLESSETQSLNATLNKQGVSTASKKSLNANVFSEQVVGFIPHRLPGATGRSAEFGWIVPPQPDVEDAQSLLFKDIPLGALVAVPSWWRTVLLRICAVGVGEEDLPAIVQGTFWTRPGKMPQYCRVEPLRLPGTAQDVPRRLGIEIINTPFVRALAFDVDKAAPNAPPSKLLEAGRPARLLLRGGRLWRSTVVTLAGQRADQIVVLPDMQGIVAEFDCVEAPETPKRGPDGLQTADILVWTSEGTTQPVSINIKVPRGFKRCSINEAMPTTPERHPGTSGGPPAEEGRDVDQH
jgi:hypothetical protein